MDIIKGLNDSYQSLKNNGIIQDFKIKEVKENYSVGIDGRLEFDYIVKIDLFTMPTQEFINVNIEG